MVTSAKRSDLKSRELTANQKISEALLHVNQALNIDVSDVSVCETTRGT